MNTIKIILMLIGIMFCAITSAQTRFYDTTRTFREAGFTYQANVNHGMVTLFNANNRHDINQRQTLRPDSPLTAEEFFSDRTTPRIIPSSSVTIPIVENIVRNALSPAERQRVGDWQMTVLLIVDQAATIPQPVTEVKFRFSPNSPFATIPVSVYRRIELEIKRQVRLAPTERGRMLSFNRRGIPIVVN